MFEYLPRISELISAERMFALALVVDVEGSSPRAPGTGMLIIPPTTGLDDERGDLSSWEVLGDLSGGCIEGAVIARAQESLRTNTAHRETFGISDDQVYQIGLTCGGIIHVLVIPITVGAPLAQEFAALAQTQPVGERTITLVTSGPEEALGIPTSYSPDVCALPGVSTMTISDPRPHQLIIFGAEAFARALTAAAKLLDWQVTVVDPRPLFATTVRFPEADRTITSWPTDAFDELEITEHTSICVLTHDSRYEVDLLCAALQSRASYVGAMGSRRTHERRIAGLRASGLAATALARLHSPIGLDLGAETPQEVAVSILGEIISHRTGASRRSLAETSGPIHASAGTG